MAIKIPAGELVVSDKRLTAIRLIATLAEGPLDALKARVKDAMKIKGARFAESSAVVARAQPSGGSRSFVTPSDLYDLVKKRTISLEQFLSCISVRQEPLRAILSEDAIAAITTPGPSIAGISLVTEFKPGARIDFSELSGTLAGLLPQLSDAA